MSAWGDSELLVELLDRQFMFLLQLDGTNQVMRLTRLLAFLHGEPQVAGLLDDLRAEAASALGAFDEADAAIRDELKALWGQHGSEIRRRLAAVTDGALDVYGSMDQFEERVAERCPVGLVADDYGPEKTTAKLVTALRHWWKWCTDIAEKSKDPLDGVFVDLGNRLNRLLAIQAFHARGLHEKRCSLAWPAYGRLIGSSALTNPVPPDSTDSVAWATFPMDQRAAADLDHADDERQHGIVRPNIDVFYKTIRADAMLLHEELRLRIGSARSRLALVQRYAARCEAFDAERLRNACDENSGNAERLLTLDLARFLFDAGLPPLIDATVGGLRPDILHVRPTSLFYVEAKQYADDHPRSQLSKAYSQVWGTWGRLRKTYPSTEAFLVVFRRSGPWVELPPVVHDEGLKLYSVVADISKEAGSREKRAAIRMTADELRPQERET